MGPSSAPWCHQFHEQEVEVEMEVVVPGSGFTASMDGKLESSRMIELDCLLYFGDGGRTKKGHRDH